MYIKVLVYGNYFLTFKSNIEFLKIILTTKILALAEQSLQLVKVDYITLPPKVGIKDVSHHLPAHPRLTARPIPFHVCLLQCKRQAESPALDILILKIVS